MIHFRTMEYKAKNASEAKLIGLFLSRMGLTE